MSHLPDIVNLQTEGAITLREEYYRGDIVYMIIAELIEELEAIAPPDLAEDGDRIGLQVGNLSSEVKRICIALDVTPAIVARAIEAQADILVTHHPLIYAPLASVTNADPVAKRVKALIRSNVALYVMHTNYDTVPGGVNDILAEKLGVIDGTPLIAGKQDGFYKIAVFVPKDHVTAVRDAMADAGAGRIGQYTHCSFYTPGTGTFVPLPAARPFIGDVGQLEEVEEFKLEMVCAGTWLDNALNAMLDKHPYDQVAYDVYDLSNEPIIYGLGRVGNLDKAVSLCDFAQKTKEALSPKYMKVEGDPDKIIKRVALCSGSGSSFYREALKAGADVYVTGDTKHHDIIDANAAGLAVIDAGHFDTEKPAMVALANRLKKMLSGSSMDIQYIE